MSGTTLLVGGPADGTWLEVPDPQKDIQVALPPLFDRRWWSEPDQAYDAVRIRQVSYRPTELNFFGTALRVHVMYGTPAERQEATLFHHLLTEPARALALPA